MDWYEKFHAQIILCSYFLLWMFYLPISNGISCPKPNIVPAYSAFFTQPSLHVCPDTEKFVAE
jgi:hypothetical protein